MWMHIISILINNKIYPRTSWKTCFFSIFSAQKTSIFSLGSAMDFFFFPKQMDISFDPFYFSCDMHRPSPLELKYLQVIPWLGLPMEEAVEREVMQRSARPPCGPSAHQCVT